MFGLIVDRNSSHTITSQLTGQLREAVLSGKIKAKSKMPPTRSLANELNVSRNTIIQVYEQLIAEGYLNSATGSGTFAADLGGFLAIKKQAASIRNETQGIVPGKDVIAFYAGNPDVSAFPRTLWAKALKEACFDAGSEDYGYGDPKGHTALRKAIAGYLYRAKGIYCGSERIFIVPGTAAGLELAASTLYSEGGCAAVEDPCLTFARRAVTRNGLKVLPVESDDQGMRTELLPGDADVKLIYTAPSHQYPLGGVLPIARRLALLEYAQLKDAYIIEDDYDSEFRYHGEPIQSLWSLNGERVIYLGSFSNVFSPALRMAYIIVPPNLIKSMTAVLNELNIWVGAIEQIALARLIEEKQFDRHIYRMKRLYDKKRKLLISCLKEAFGRDIDISGELAGLHFLVSLKRELTEDDIRGFADNGIGADFAESYALIKGRHTNKLVLGYGNLSEAEIEEGVKRLKGALNRTHYGHAV